MRKLVFGLLILVGTSAHALFGIKGKDEKACIQTFTSQLTMEKKQAEGFCHDNHSPTMVACTVYIYQNAQVEPEVAIGACVDGLKSVSSASFQDYEACYVALVSRGNIPQTAEATCLADPQTYKRPPPPVQPPVVVTPPTNPPVVVIPPVVVGPTQPTPPTTPVTPTLPVGSFVPDYPKVDPVLDPSGIQLLTLPDPASDPLIVGQNPAPTVVPAPTQPVQDQTGTAQNYFDLPK